MMSWLFTRILFGIRFGVLFLTCIVLTFQSATAFAAAVSSSSTNPCDPDNPARRAELEFRESNDILYYDECSGCGSGGSGSSSGSSGTGSSNTNVGDAGGCGTNAGNDPGNESQIKNYLVTQFKSDGFSDTDAQNAAYGVMGNWMQESGMNSYESSGKGCGSSAAFGIAQWCGDRITKAKQFIEAQGKPDDCLGGQLEYAWSEIAANPGLINDLKGKSAAQDALAFDSDFEKSTDGKTLSNVRETNAASLSQGNTGPAGGASAASSSTTGSSGSNTCSTASNDGTCQNPFRDLKNSGISRIDGGYDYGGSGGSGPVYAACPAQITFVESAGAARWPGNGSFISYKITAGSANGLYMYIAEDCTATVKVGDTVTTSQPICNYNDGGTELETGWGQASNSGYVSWSDYPPNQYSCDSSGDFASNSGIDVDKFLQTIGLPHDKPQCASSSGSPPADWPKWGSASSSTNNAAENA